MQRIRAALRRLRASGGGSDVFASPEEELLFTEVLEPIAHQYLTAAGKGYDVVTIRLVLPPEVVRGWVDVARRVARFVADEDAMRVLRSPAVSGRDGAFVEGLLDQTSNQLLAASANTS